MTIIELNALRSHICNLTYPARQEFKRNEVERLGYNRVDPISILIWLENLNLFWVK